MESILSLHDEVYPLKNRRSKATIIYPNKKIHSVHHKTNIFSLIYQYIKKIIIQRSVYILGVLNLMLAAIAIVCVTQAEDHPEQFSLVYIAVSIFIFYMIIIIFIIALQIFEAYQERNKLSPPSLLIQVPSLKSTIVESLPTKTQPETRLIRSHTIPKLAHHYMLSTSSSTFKEFNQSNRLKLIPNLPNNIDSHLSPLTFESHLNKPKLQFID